MAQSRVHTFGTIFSRVSGLIKAGAMKYEDRPAWFDVYRAFPPLQDPHIDRKLPDDPKPRRKLIYPEDVLRAEFFKKFGSPGNIKLTIDSSTCLMQMFVDKYYELASQENCEPEKLFDATCAALETAGIRLPTVKKTKIIYT